MYAESIVIWMFFNVDILDSMYLLAFMCKQANLNNFFFSIACYYKSGYMCKTKKDSEKKSYLQDHRAF